jgi:hypothetical protein
LLLRKVCTRTTPSFPFWREFGLPQLSLEDGVVQTQRGSRYGFPFVVSVSSGFGKLTVR